MTLFALGLAMESMLVYVRQPFDMKPFFFDRFRSRRITLLTVKFIPFFLITWCVSFHLVTIVVTGITCVGEVLPRK